MTDKYKNLQIKINVDFSDMAILDQAFIHRSYLNESSEETNQSNERLEFLGDAVLQFLTSEYIYKNLNDYTEGQLTNLRSRLVNTDSLAEESSRLGLSQYLQISKGEKETASESNYILADTFEALLGAIYLDQGIDKCREYLVTNLFYKTQEIIDEGELKDPKSLYQEQAQEKHGVTPSYRLISDEGPDHQKTFTVGVFLNDKLIAKGDGSSKRKAQQVAAHNALLKETKNE